MNVNNNITTFVNLRDLKGVSSFLLDIQNYTYLSFSTSDTPLKANNFKIYLSGVYVGGGISFCLWSISDNFKSIKHKMKASKILFKEMAYLDTKKQPKCHSFTTDMLAKANRISSNALDGLRRRVSFFATPNEGNLSRGIVNYSGVARSVV